MPTGDEPVSSDYIVLKCPPAPAYHDLAEVGTANRGVHSRPDRAAEWTTVRINEGMLGLVRKELIDASAIEQCEFRPTTTPT